MSEAHVSFCDVAEVEPFSPLFIHVLRIEAERLRRKTEFELPRSLEVLQLLQGEWGKRELDTCFGF